MRTLTVKRKERLLRAMARMEKTAADATDDALGEKKPASNLAKMIAGGVLGAGVLAGGSLLARRGIRTHVADWLKARAQGKGPHAVADARAAAFMKSPEGAALKRDVDAQAKEIVAQLRAQGLDPSNLRIGVAGTGGTGKSTLAEAIAREAKTKRVDLDLSGASSKPGGLGEYLRGRKNAPRGEVLEQSHLFTQVDPKAFDVMVHVERPTKAIHQSLLKRRRGAWQADLYDYGKLNKDIDTAFNLAGGKIHTVKDTAAGRVRMQVRPQEGWSGANMDAKLTSLNATPEQLAGMTHLQKVQAAATGTLKSRRLSGPIGYVKKEPIVTTGLLGAAGAAGGAAAMSPSQPSVPRRPKLPPTTKS